MPPLDRPLNPGDRVQVVAGKRSGALGVVVGPSSDKPGLVVVRSDRTAAELAFKPEDLILIPALDDQRSISEVPIETVFPPSLSDLTPRCDQETSAVPAFPALASLPANYGADVELAQFVDASPMPPIATATYPDTLADVILSAPVAVAALAIAESRRDLPIYQSVTTTSRQGDRQAIRIETYQNRAGSYYRLAWSEGHRKCSRHIPGGNVESRIARDRVSRLAVCINQGGSLADCLKILHL